MLLPCFRAAAIAWAAGTWPARATGLRSVAAAVRFFDAVADASASAAASAASGSACSAATRSPTDANSLAADAADAAAYAANAAGYTARTVAYAANAAATFRQINHDVDFIRRGGGAHGLGLEPLWQETFPHEIHERWEQFLDVLPSSRHQHWNVWIDWYHDRGLGSGSGRAVIEELEIARILIPDEDWKKGPEHVNALIQRLEDQYRQAEDDEEGDIAEAMFDLGDEIDDADPEEALEVAEVPAQRPAVVEVEVGRDRRIHRKLPSPPEADDADAEADLRDAYEAHRAILNALTRSDPGRNWPDLKLALADYADALGASFDVMNVIATGVHGERLGQFVLRADIELMEGAAADLTSLFTAHAVFIRQFPRWRRYLDRNRPPPDPEVVQAAVETAGSLKDFPGLFGDDVVEAAERQAMPIRDIVANSEDRLPPIVESSLVDSILNVTFGASAPTAEFLKDATSEGREAALDLTYVATFLGLASVSNLVLKLPMELTFVPALLALIAKRQSRKPKVRAEEKSNEEG